MQKPWCELVDEKLREIRKRERQDRNAFDRLVKELEDHPFVEQPRWYVKWLSGPAAEFRFRDQTVFHLNVSGGAVHIKAGDDSRSFDLETQEDEMRDWTASLMARAVYLDGAVVVELTD